MLATFALIRDDLASTVNPSQFQTYIAINDITILNKLLNVFAFLSYAAVVFAGQLVNLYEQKY